MISNRWVKDPLLSIVNNHAVDYPTPINISYLWSFGALSGLCLVIQIVTGIFLAMHYSPHVDLAFASVEHIMRDVPNGWLLRYLHANGASFMFICLYIHMFRGLYFGSYSHPREHLWCSGVVIFIVTILVGFIGYVIPWGQMSYWGATVITNLVSAVPFVGESIVQWIWGGFSVDNATINRFFSLHYLLPFVVAGLSLVHITILHQNGSNNPIGIDSSMDKIPFWPYFWAKDLFSIVLLLCFYFLIVFFYPNLLGHPDNYIPANPIVTPAHIVPEWYFLPFYAILRSIPNKLGGVIAMVGAILGLMAIPFINTSEVRSTTFRPIFKQFYWLFVANFIALGWIGGNVVEYPYIEIGQFCTFYYFFFLFVIIPVLGVIESNVMRSHL
jgi:ubiquinol-cytochrome c reductase cytochrome b subunit